jgi:hypothetical protein
MLSLSVFFCLFFFCKKNNFFNSYEWLNNLENQLYKWKDSCFMKYESEQNKYPKKNLFKGLKKILLGIFILFVSCYYFFGFKTFKLFPDIIFIFLIYTGLKNILKGIVHYFV